ncbi:MAG: biotin-dependent carboxyltransferase family protein [Desulfobacterales bacterium]
MATVAVMEVKAAGPLTTIQDRGRFGFGRYGVAPSGALDSVAMRIANLLVDNPEEEAVLEITLPGFSATLLADAVIAITGADLGWHRNGRPLGMWQAHRFHKGDTIVFMELNSGCRAYLSVGGGWEVPEIMGSKSTNLSSGFGGLGGRPLQKGDVLGTESPQLFLGAGGRKFDLNAVPAYRGYWELRVVLGPQDDHFDAAAQDLFLNSDYRVSAHSDRTGIRLLGAQISAEEGRAESILSEGVVAGTVQIPGDGQPIILLGETVSGGYRKIATVITADLHLLGQVLPGDHIRFQAVTMREARQALWRLEEMIGRFRDSLS